MKKQWLRLLAALLALIFVAAACTSDDGGTTETGDDETEESTESESEEEESDDEEEAMEDDEEAMEDEEDAAGGDGEAVKIFGPESSDEEAGAFQDALAVWSEESGVAVEYVGASDFSDQINVQIAGGTAPDIAIFPQPGKVADFARSGDILPVPDDVTIEWGEAWTAFGNVDGTQYGVPNKADLKSLVWYKPATFAEKGYEVPETFDDFVGLTEKMIANGDTPLCVGIESDAATGWTFTDWVEDMMLRVAGPEAYDQWVSHELPFSDPIVQDVFSQVNDLWQTEGMVFASGGSIATTSFRDNGQPLVDGDCMMHRQASFYAAFIPEGTPYADGSDEAVDVFYFPSTGADKPVLGAGTLATAFTDSEDVWAVMEYLGSAAYAENRQTAQVERKGGGLSGFLSAADGQDPSVYSPLEQSFLEILESSEVVRFDASDLMPSEVGAGTFWSEGTSFVNGDIDVAEATKRIDDSWPDADAAEEEEAEEEEEDEG